MTKTPSLGVLEVLDSGSGFIRRRETNYVPGADDIYVAQKLVNQFNLRTGDEIAGEIGRSPGRGKSAPLTRIVAVNDVVPEQLGRRPEFQRLTAVHPKDQLLLECDRTIRGQPDFTNRIIDLFCPLGKGQRALIVAPSKAGKTMVMQAVAEGIVKNDPDCLVMILLVDERPEEVTEMEACGYGEVVASSFDNPAEQHVTVAEITLERARRHAEMGKDVVIILDSITRLARGYNAVEQSTGRTLSGGLDAGALEKPKRFLGSARYIDPKQGGGSLTIIATALIDTGSRMDQVIFEEFKGTGNSELVLSRELADRRIFPAIDINKSGTRKEELLLPKEELNRVFILRRVLNPLSPVETMELLLDKLGKTRSNGEFLSSMSG